MRKLVPFIAGIVIAILVFLFAIKVSNDLRVLYGLGVFLLFAIGIGLSSKGWRGAAAWFGLCAPVIALFEYEMLVGRNVPLPLSGLILYAALWALAGLFALLWNSEGPRKMARIGSVMLIAFSGLYVVTILPAQTARMRNHYESKPAPEFSLQTLDGTPMVASSFKDSVVVIDFFSETCEPCIAEIPELERARLELKDHPEVRFLLVVSDLGGDTPESIRAFTAKHGVEMPIAYDKGGIAHDAFGFVGVPSLVVLDKSGSIRLTRQGFNRADTNFRSDLVNFVSGL